MSYDFDYDGITMRNKRPNNQDAVAMCLQEIGTEQVGLFMVADGVGGTERGKDSADFMVQELGDWFFAQHSTRHLGTSFSQQVFALNQELLEWLGDKTGASTLSALLLTQHNAFFCHVGDSRIYQSQEDSTLPWTQRTRDHITPDGKLVEYLGKNNHLSVDFWEEPLLPCRFLLCSDGFYRKLDWKTGATLLGTAEPQGVREALIQQAKGNIHLGETDNCSALLVTVGLVKEA